MTDVDTHTSEYQELRKKLFNLKLRLAMERKAMTEEEVKGLQDDIKQAKKDLAHYAFLAQTMSDDNKNNGGMKK
jgi:ribosomal protein L29